MQKATDEEIMDGKETVTYEDGERAPCIVTKSRVWKPDDLKEIDPSLPGLIVDLVRKYTATEEVSRRLSVLQVWEARHFDRGYQQLDNAYGGWRVPGVGGNNNSNPIASQDDQNIYPTNILAAQGDIITGALNRGAIKVSFTPVRSKEPSDSKAADKANQYKYVWYDTNKATELQRIIAGIFWTDPRCILWTKSIKHKAKFGSVINGDEEEIRTVEVTTAHGLLESRLPMGKDSICDCSYLNIYEEVDYSRARSMFPWAKDKIKPTDMAAVGETEFEKIARINTHSGLIGKYIIGTNNMRDTTMCYSWQRAEVFESDDIKDSQRQFLNENFPDGLFIILSGDNLMCCWEESMDDHIALGFATRGFGQNRRALCSSDVPIQKKVNIWADLWDQFIRGSIPITILDNQAFNAEAISELNASPRRFINAVAGEGQTLQELVATTPQAQPVQGALDMFNLYTGPLLQSVDGATPSLQGNAEGTQDTVGGTQMRLNQSLERVGPVWLSLCDMFATAVYQGAKLCAENGNSELSGNYQGNDVSLNPVDLKGNFKVKAETTNAIPESGTQTEAKLFMILDMANSNPAIAELIGKPSNAKNIVRAMHMDDILNIEEADSVDKQMDEIEKLLDSEPIINPAYHELQAQIEQLNEKHEIAKQLAVKAVSGGQTLQPEISEQGSQMEAQLQKLQQQLTTVSQYLPSIQAEKDESVDHATEADTVFSWMNGCDGAELRAKSLGKEFGDPNWNKFTNVYLHWKGHKDMIKQLNDQNAQAPIPKLGLTGKMTPDQISQLLTAAGVQISQQQAQLPITEQHTETIQRTPFAEKKTKTVRKL